MKYPLRTCGKYEKHEKVQGPVQRIPNEAKKRYPQLFLPQDEFETTSECNQRLKQQKDVIKKVEQELIAEEKAKQREAKRLTVEQAAEVGDEENIILDRHGTTATVHLFLERELTISILIK